MNDNHDRYPDLGFDIIPVLLPTTVDYMSETATFRTDINHTRVIGIALTISASGALPNSLIGLKIGGKEVFPNEFEAKMLYVADGAVPPNDRFYKFEKGSGIEVDESEVDIRWKDGNNAGFSPPNSTYTAKVYLMCEKKLK